MNFEIILIAFANLNILDLVYISGGVLIGIILAAIPGLSGSIGMAILLPFTYLLSPIRSLATLGGLYAGSLYGGSISAVLLNIPGTGAAVATAIDGYPLAQKGKSAEALYASVFASFFGGIVGTIFLLFLVKPLSRLSLKFGPVEFFWLAILGISTIASLTSGNLIKGIIMGLFGLFLSTIGLDPLTGNDRFSFGIPELTGGIHVIPIIISMFAIPQIFKYLEEQVKSIGNYEAKKGVGLKVAKEMIHNMLSILIKSSLIGTIIGIIPGAGGYVASLVAYIETKNSSKDRDEFGSGKLEGVVAAESGNSATAGGALIPMLTFGIPGSNVTAVMIGALLLHGFEPGPDLFAKHGDIVYTFILSLFFSYIVMLIYGIYGPKFFSKILNVRINILVSSLMVICVIGAYSIRNNMTDIIVMLVLGYVGYFFMKLDFPLPPVVLGLILGNIAETGLRQGIALSSVQNSIFLFFFFRPISVVLIILTILIVIFPFYQEFRRKKNVYKESMETKAKVKFSFIKKDKKKKLSDIIVSILFIVFSLYLINLTRQYPPETKIFPIFIFTILIILSVLLIINNIIKKEWASIKEGLFGKFNTIPWFKLIGVMLIYFLFVVTFPEIGFLIGSFIFILVMLFVADTVTYTKKELPKVILRYIFFSLSFVLIIYFIFIKTLNLYLPINIFKLFIL